MLTSESSPSPTPRIFMTGANGLLGSVIAQNLLSAGYPLSAMRRASSSMDLLGPSASGISWIEADLMDISSYRDALENADIVIHAAAMVSFDKRDHARMMDINVRGTAELVDAALEAGIQHFIQISSIAAIGRVKDAGIIDEQTKWVDSDLNSQYAISKYQAELEVWRGGEEGLPFSIINPSVVLGMGDLQQSSAKLFKYVWDQKPFYTDAIVNYVDVEDVAEAVRLLVSKGPQNDRFIISAGDIPYKTLFGHMAKNHSLISQLLFLKSRPQLEIVRIELFDKFEMFILKGCGLSCYRVPFFDPLNGIELRKCVFGIDQIQIQLIDIR